MKAWERALHCLRTLCVNLSESKIHVGVVCIIFDSTAKAMRLHGIDTID